MNLGTNRRDAGLVALLGCLLLVGCQHASVDAVAEIHLDFQCEDPRPEVCTMDYRPVCGLRDTGVRCITTPCPSAEWKTYSNGCSACSDAEVFGYTDGGCTREGATVSQ